MDEANPTILPPPRRFEETIMYPDGYIWIYRAEQTARARAHLRYADHPARPRSTLSDLIHSLTNRHLSTAGAHMRGGRLAWRRR